MISLDELIKYGTCEKEVPNDSCVGCDLYFNYQNFCACRSLLHLIQEAKWFKEQNTLSV